MRKTGVGLSDNASLERFGRQGPNLFIIGAMKSGTSSLHECLSQHPEIFMSRTKEPAFFQLDDDMPSWKSARTGVWNDLDLYLSLFEGGINCRFRGESTTDYTKAPSCECAAERIYAHQPNARIIYMMRDPVKRAISHYWWNVSHEGEVREPLRAFREDPQYADVSRYATQIEPYLKTFGRDRVFAFTFEEFVGNQGESLAKLFLWLGVAPVSAGMIHLSRSNPTPDVVVQARVAGWPRRVLNGSVASSIGVLIPRSIRKSIRAALERRVERKKVDLSDSEAFLRETLSSEVPRLMHLLGREFREWDLSA